MHRDLKLGLALAVLLIGSTTAFFFRNDADSDSGLPQLQNPERFDAALSRGSLAPELGPPEDFQLTRSDNGANDQPIWTRPAFLGGSSTASVRRTSVTPDPIRIIFEDDVEPFGSHAASPAGTMLLKPSVGNGGARDYIVQPGDTLTGLASRFLGSLTRYHEIYELNRDRLSGPDDLRIGMSLRIPAANAVTPTSGIVERPPARSDGTATENDDSPAAHPPSEDDPSIDDATSDDVTGDAAKPVSSDAGKLFVPARKAPFVPQRFRRPHSESGDTPSSK